MNCFSRDNIYVSNGMIIKKKKTRTTVEENRLLVGYRNYDPILLNEKLFHLGKMEYVIQDIINGIPYQECPFLLRSEDLESYPFITIKYPKLKQVILTPDTITSWLPHILFAVKTLHQKNIYHLDINPNNILYCSTDDKYILIDYGTCVCQNIITFKHVVGTLGYIAPELYLKKNIYLDKLDIYSLGRLIFYVQHGFHLRDDEIQESVTQGIINAYATCRQNYILTSFDRIVSRMICVDPQQRYSIDEVIVACNLIL